MRRWRWALAIAPVLLAQLVLSQPVARADTVVDITNIKGDGVFAEFEYTNDNIITFVTVTTSADEVLRPPQPGGPAEEPFTVVSIFQVNLATGSVLLSADGFVREHIFTVDDDLEAARLQATVRMSDRERFHGFDVKVNLTWTATGELERDHVSTHHFNVPGFVHNARFRGEHRQARATGSIEVDGVNYTPFPSTDAEIQSNQAGSVTVQVE